MRLALVAITLLACGPSDDTSGDSSLELCGNGVDDDGNGQLDCADSACSCPEVCDGNALDEDQDGAIDCDDADCDGSCGEADRCDDGRDNDADGLTDCDDIDCTVPECAEDCTDGRDNDADGATDCSDSDCNVVECTELCADGRDNDADSAVDCDDMDCDGSCPENCADGRDNDLDGFADCDDSQCEAECPEDCLNFQDDDADGAIDCLDAECAFACDQDLDGFLNEAHGGDDCDDTNPIVNPEGDEVCNGLDDDCNGLTDMEDIANLDPTTVIGFHPDADADTFGARDTPVVYECTAPEGYGIGSDDCDDLNPDINPAATEVCDGLDNDCDNLKDDKDPSVDLATASDWWTDADDDGFGDPGASVFACNPPVGTVDNDLDCDDTDPLLLAAADWLPDNDDDGYGAGVPAGIIDCFPPAGGPWASEVVGEDCDDTNPAINPGEIEVCSGIDEDCDLDIDEDDLSFDEGSYTPYYPDVDEDGYGNKSVGALLACFPAAPYTAVTNTDCNDLDADISPVGLEVCDGIDNDCDNKVDDADASVDLSTATNWYVDADKDGFGVPGVPIFACAPPPGRAPNDTDCDDTDPMVFGPGDWVPDLDGDGYGDGALYGVVSCDPPEADLVSEYLDVDCNESDPGIHPGATEICEDLIDQNCDGLDETCFTGEKGPDFSADGWHQCAGWFDTMAAGEIPASWAPECQEPDDNVVRVACGADLANYNFIDVEKNPFRDGLVSYPETGIIYNADFGGHLNQIYATGNDPDVSTSWWGTGDGCNEFAKNITVNNICTWEASNCFGQGLVGPRYLWVYAKAAK